MKYLVISDSFKGSMSSKEVGEVITSTLKDMGHVADYILISDGGEGFLDALKSTNKDLKFITYPTYDALRRKKDARFLYDEKTKNAYFELAEVVGIKDLKEDELNVFKASTYGLGNLIMQALNDYEINDIYVGLGGSASNDGASGMLEALGLIFKDENGNIITALNNEKLSSVKEVDYTLLNKVLRYHKFIVLSDVTNPLLGENGATYVYSIQKGAKENDLTILESNLRNFAEVTKKTLYCDYSIIDGAGAAGGCGFGMISYLNAKVYSGIDVILKLNNLDIKINDYDEIITGEGSFDNQSLNGKVISGILKYDIKKLSICCGISKINNFKYKIYSIVPNICTKEESLKNPKIALEKLIKESYK